MKDFSQQELEGSRPNVSAKTAINHCLKMLFDDKIKLSTI